jgi:hypothetical protein
MQKKKREESLASLLKEGWRCEEKKNFILSYWMD